MAVTLNLNGLTHEVDLDPGTLLIYVLRNELSLHGAKLGCGLEQCGACVVLADGEPVHACSLRLEDAAGRRIETVEGLSDNHGTLHPLQQAFIELNAVQCGFCAPGIIMRIKALLDANVHPTREEVCEALAGHLCRCGAHPRMIHAVERAIAITRVESQ
jgi:aerobic-type carbon monoxide dehydrogenase small subunit (CoxS/CutS family)